MELRQEILSLGMSVFFVFIMIALSTSDYVTIKTGERQIASIKAEKAEIVAKVTALKDTNDQMTQKQARLASFRDVVNRKSYWVESFKELTTLMPKDVWLTSFHSTVSDQDKNITLKGEAASQEKVAEFVRALEKSTYFNTLLIKVSEKLDDYRPNLYKFEFNIPTKGGKS